tara:strand:+ start:4344 stop:5177 length:834 start_codon:yes stop_codon:yes gene_type:complete
MSEAEATQEIGSQESAPPAASFQDSLPEDLRGNPSLKNFNDVGSLAKSYVHAQRMVGADKIPLPGNNSTDDDWSRVYDKLGRPADIKDYDVSLPEIFEDDGFRKSIHAAGLNQKQAASVAQFMQSQTEAANGKLDAYREQAKLDTETELRAEYGKAFGEKVQRAQATAKYLLGSKGDPTSEDNILGNIRLADGRMLGDHPDIIRMFEAMSHEIAEDDLDGVTTESAMTPQDAQEEIDQLQADRKGAYWNKHHPEHDKAVARVQELFAYVHPEEDIVL